MRGQLRTASQGTRTRRESHVLQRHITPRIIEAMGDTPVVVLHGARQTGKSTLVRSLFGKDHPTAYYSLDQAAVLTAARDDPEGFIARAQTPLILDEIQRAPELLLAIKASVDNDRRPGRFLLTGSAHVLQLPRLADSLAGRMEILTLWPLSQGEILGRKEGFLDALFTAKPDVLLLTPTKKRKTPSRNDLVRQIVTGGYPEAVLRKDSARRNAWFESYIDSILLRDIRDLASITGIDEIPDLLAASADRAAKLLNYADLGRDVGLNQMTVKRYFSLLTSTFILQPTRPWFTNRIKRITKSEKLYFGDTGLLAHLLKVSADDFSHDHKAIGALLENFVAVELMKQASWSQARPAIMHFRDYQGTEVDIVIEGPGNRLVGIEVKARTTISPKDFRGLQALAKTADERFHCGILLYGGETPVPFGKNILALPISYLWQVTSTQ
jgi:predicted AAA+ superfamily ATPase